MTAAPPPRWRLRVTYRLHVPSRHAAAAARAVALEQTVELPDALLPRAVADSHAGRVDALEVLGPRSARAVVSYPAATVGTELTQLLNVLYGNVSLRPGIVVEQVDWPPELLAAHGGPGHGIAGLRALTGVHHRPLLATALKPVGLSAAELATLARDFAAGGLDLVKDDHGLADQASAPFYERLMRCQAAVSEVNATRATRCLYAPNITAPRETLLQRAEQARAAGCQMVLAVPWLTGLDALAAVRDRTGLAILAHPGLTGSYFSRHAGIRAEVLLGELFRIAGADAVIYPNIGGRFDLSATTCAAINERLRAPLGGLRPALPTPAGGIDAARAPHWVRRYGVDTALLIGASLYAQGPAQAAAAALRAAVEQSLE